MNDIKNYIFYHLDTQNPKIINSFDELYKQTEHSLNRAYSEVISIRDIWESKKYPKIIGTAQYRRSIVIDWDNVPNLLKSYDAIIPINIFNTTIRQQYAQCHNIKDLELVEKIINEYYPEFNATKIFNDSKFVYSNLFITSDKIFNEACTFLFKVVDEFIKIKGIIDDEQLLTMYKTPYQARIIAFISERILTVFWLNKNIYKTKFVMV